MADSTNENNMSEYFKEIRKKIGHDKLLVPGTSCLIVNERDEILLLLRSDTEEWVLPGGFMDIGETVIESLEREVREETGLTVSDPCLFGIYSGPDFEMTHPGGDETAPVTLVFLVRRYDGEMQKSDESRQPKFFPVNDLPTPLNPITARLLKDYQEYREERREMPTIL